MKAITIVLKVGDQVVMKDEPKNPFLERKVVTIKSIRKHGRNTVARFVEVKGSYMLKDFLPAWRCKVKGLKIKFDYGSKRPQ